LPGTSVAPSPASSFFSPALLPSPHVSFGAAPTQVRQIFLIVDEKFSADEDCENYHSGEKVGGYGSGGMHFARTRNLK
jgi:hypothetical protein